MWFGDACDLYVITLDIPFAYCFYWFSTSVLQRIGLKIDSVPPALAACPLLNVRIPQANTTSRPAHRESSFNQCFIGIVRALELQSRKRTNSLRRSLVQVTCWGAP
jgi:hypothetical protein